MNGRSIVVTAPSRLHFGMFSFGQPGVRQFGGVGCMIDRPGIKLSIVSAHRFEVCGAMAERASEFAKRFWHSSGTSGELQCRIEVQSAPRPHVGLGSGTQLGLAVAAGLQAFLRGPDEPFPGCAPKKTNQTLTRSATGYGTTAIDAEALARSIGRGRRSAIGTHGFERGGFLVEAGKSAEQDISPLLARVDLTEAWRFVLLCPKNLAGLSGDAERRAFEQQLPPVPIQTTDVLCREAFLQLLPAAIEGRFEAFSESLYQFGRLAGSCFASLQGGPYGGQQVTQLVERCRGLGIRGVGQTSWGPTVFALLPNEQCATQFVDEFDDQELDVTIAAPARGGVKIVVN